MSGVQRSGGGAVAQAAALGDRIVLSARQVPDRGELGAVVRAHGRVQREVSPFGFQFDMISFIGSARALSIRVFEPGERSSRVDKRDTDL